jgi:hypothetical protein
MSIDGMRHARGISESGFRTFRGGISTQEVVSLDTSAFHAAIRNGIESEAAVSSPQARQPLGWAKYFLAGCIEG